MRDTFLYLLVYTRTIWPAPHVTHVAPIVYISNRYRNVVRFDIYIILYFMVIVYRVRFVKLVHIIVIIIIYIYEMIAIGIRAWLLVRDTIYDAFFGARCDVPTKRLRRKANTHTHQNIACNSKRNELATVFDRICNINIHMSQAMRFCMLYAILHAA